MRLNFDFSVFRRFSGRNNWFGGGNLKVFCGNFSVERLFSSRFLLALKARMYKKGVLTTALKSINTQSALNPNTNLSTNCKNPIVNPVTTACSVQHNQAAPTIATSLKCLLLAIVALLLLFCSAAKGVYFPFALSGCAITVFYIFVFNFCVLLLPKAGNNYL